MTNQEAFDGIMKWLTRENGKRCSTAPGRAGQCMYYDNVTQNRCAIGGHLPLKIARALGDASVGIEGLLTQSEEELWDVENLDLDVVPKINDFYSGVDTELLDALQRLHDESRNWNFNGGFSSRGYTEAQEIAGRYNLECSFYLDR